MKVGIVPRDNWTDPKFRRLSPSTKLVLFYLLTCPEGNSAQLFQVLPEDIAVRTGLSVEEVESSMQILAEKDYLKYDPDTPLVWLESAMRRELGDRLKFDDNRVKHIRRIVAHLPVCAIRADFLKRYLVPYHLAEKKATGKSKDRNKETPSQGGFEQASEGAFDASLEGAYEGGFEGSLQDNDNVNDNSEAASQGSEVGEEERYMGTPTTEGWDEDVRLAAHDWTEDPDMPATPPIEMAEGEERFRV